MTTSFQETQRDALYPRYYIRQAVFAQQVGMLYAQSYFGAVATIVTASLLTYVLSSGNYDALVRVWYGAVVLVTLCRVGLALIFHRFGVHARDSRNWYFLFWIGAMITAVLWGAAASMLLIANDLVQDMLILLILMGMLAGSAPVLCAAKWVYECYLLVAISPVLPWLFLEPVDQDSLILTLLVLLFTLGLLKAASGFRNAIKASFRLAVENEKIARDLYQANETKSLFLANISHEIRTPMNAVIGMGRMLAETSLTARQQNYLKMIQTSANGLLRIINDLLDFSRAEAGKLEVERTPFEFQDVVDSLRDLLTNAAEEKGLELVFSIDPTIPAELIGDPLRLGQVLTNLTQNAIKFTQQGSVLISISVEEHYGRHVTLSCSVKDTGIGIDPEKIDKLFNPFTQADESTTRQYGGTGLGLAICRRLVELMDGEIEVQSELGHGSEFHFTARFRLVSAVGVLKADAPMPELQHKRAWVIYDNLTVSHTLVEQLDALSLSSVIFPSCSQALKTAGETRLMPDILIVKGDYIEAESELKTLQRALDKMAGHPIPILFMVTDRQRDNLGVLSTIWPDSDLLNKPVILPVLKTALCQRLLGQPAPVRSEQPGPDSSNPETGEQRPISATAPKVLLVEDNLYNRIVAQDSLEQLGLKVYTAGNGHSAIEQVTHQDFDLVLMDIQMPDMDGFEATTAIRRLEKTETLPILAMTAHAVDGYKSKCLEAGMNDYIAKPFTPSDLQRKLKRWVKVTVVTEPISDNSVQDTQLHESLGLPGRLPGIDVQSGLYYVGGNLDLYKRLLSNFRYQQSKTFEQLVQAARQDDVEQVLFCTHNLRAICGNIGAQRLKQLIEELEAAAEQGILSEKQQLAEVIDAEYHVLIAALPESEAGASVQAGIAPVAVRSPERVQDPEESGMLFAELQDAMARGDTESLQLVRKMRQLHGDEWQGCSLLDIEQELLAYQFDSALEITYNAGHGAVIHEFSGSG